MKSGSHYWKLLKTIPFAKLAFQSYSIQTYLWLSRSAKWVLEREKSQLIQISIVSTSAKNVVYTQPLSKYPGNKQVPVTSFVHIDEKESSQSVATECEQLANVYSKELSFRTVLSSHKLSTKMSCKSETSRKHQESRFVCQWLQCSYDINNLLEIDTREKRTRPNRFASIRI